MKLAENASLSDFVAPKKFSFFVLFLFKGAYLLL